MYRSTWWRDKKREGVPVSRLTATSSLTPTSLAAAGAVLAIGVVLPVSVVVRLFFVLPVTLARVRPHWVTGDRDIAEVPLGSAVQGRFGGFALLLMIRRSEKRRRKRSQTGSRRQGISGRRDLQRLHMVAVHVDARTREPLGQGMTVPEDGFKDRKPVEAEVEAGRRRRGIEAGLAIHDLEC